MRACTRSARWESRCEKLLSPRDNTRGFGPLFRLHPRTGRREMGYVSPSGPAPGAHVTWCRRRAARRQTRRSCGARRRERGPCLRTLGARPRARRQPSPTTEGGDPPRRKSGQARPHAASSAESGHPRRGGASRADGRLRGRFAGRPNDVAANARVSSSAKGIDISRQRLQPSRHRIRCGGHRGPLSTAGAGPALPRMSKSAVADAILSEILRLRAAAGRPVGKVSR